MVLHFTYCLPLPSNEPSSGLEVDAKSRELGLLALAHEFDPIDMQRNRISVNGEDTCL